MRRSMGRNRSSDLWINETHRLLFLGPFAKLRKAFISFVMSSHPPAWNKPEPTGFFEDLSRKFKSD